MSRLTIVTVQVAVILTFFATALVADASAWESKREARHYAAKQVEDLHIKDDWSLDWWVEPARRCDWIDHPHKIDCEYILAADGIDDIIDGYADADFCVGIIRMIDMNYGTWYRWRTHHIDCYYHGDYHETRVLARG